MAAGIDANNAVEWTSRSKNNRLQFTLSQGTVKADLFAQKLDGSGVYEKRYSLKERHMTIERYNLNELLRGMAQVTVRMDQLSVSQKEAVLISLKERQIEIINDMPPTSGRINILALP